MATRTLTSPPRSGLAAEAFEHVNERVLDAVAILECREGVFPGGVVVGVVEVAPGLSAEGVFRNQNKSFPL